MPSISVVIPQQDTRPQMPYSGRKRGAPYRKKAKDSCFAPIMGYKWFKVACTVNAPLFKAPISPR